MNYLKRKSLTFYLPFLLLLLVMTMLLNGVPSYAASGITLAATVQTSFPNYIQFNIDVKGDAEIVDLRLHYVVNRQNFAIVISESQPIFLPAKSVNTRWVWDMRKSSLPVGAQLDYWWTAADASGRTAETPRNRFIFADERYNWQSITTDPVTILWYKGDKSFANSLMTAAQEGLRRIENDTGAVPQGKVSIYIYGSTNDLQGAQLFAPDWEGGVTFTGYDIIAIGVAPSELSWGQRAVPHELTHWAIHQITFNNYGADLPTWLDEGLATYGEGKLNPDYQSALNSAIKDNRLISVQSLSSPFSAVSEEALISYGESNSIVTFLIRTYGKGKMIELLKVFQQGSAYNDALKQVYGFDQDGLDIIWRKSLIPRISGLEISPVKVLSCLTATGSFR
jgi:hypothetical protein